MNSLFNFISSVFDFFPRIHLQLAHHQQLHPRPRANTWQLLNKFIIRLDARFRDSVGAPCFFQYIRAAIYSLQIVPNWQPATSYLRPTFVHAHTHTQNRGWWAQARMTHPPVWPVGFRLIRWLTGCTRPDLAYIVATHVCTRKCTFDIIFLAHVSSIRVSRLLRGDLIANRFPRIRDGGADDVWPASSFPPARACMQRYIYVGVTFQRVDQRLG